MKASELILKLSEAMAECGDIDVIIDVGGASMDVTEVEVQEWWAGSGESRINKFSMG